MTPERFKHVGKVSEKYEWKCTGCGVLTTSLIFNGGRFNDDSRFRCVNCGKINYFNPKERGRMFLNERCVGLRDIAEHFQDRGNALNACFLTETASYMNIMNNRIIELQDAIQSVLDDSESGEGFGPDVTVCEKLRSVMPEIGTPNAARERRAEAARSADVASPTPRAC